MRVCAVVNCDAKKYIKNLSYHRFPVDDFLRKKWRSICGRNDIFDCKLGRVCSNHFSDDDFERDLRSELMGEPRKRCLKFDAEPHLNLVRIKEEPIDSDYFETEKEDNHLPYIISTESTSIRYLDNSHFESGNFNLSNIDGESTAPVEPVQSTSLLIVTNPVSSSASYIPASLPATENWPGIYDFAVSFRQQEKNLKGITWTFSKTKDKLYVGKDVPCPINFSANTLLEDNVSIRAMALYSSPEHSSEVVHRCVNHSMDELTKGIFEAEHLIRCESSMASYEIDQTTKRHSVLVPFENPPAGQHYSTYIYKFACFGSCAGGPNRRPIMLIFLLEQGGHVVGRHRLDLKICACPGRDRRLEEQQSGIPDTSQMPLKRKESENNILADRLEFSRTMSAPMSKKAKMNPAEGPYVIRAVDKEQYEFLKQMKKFDEIYRTMSNLPPSVKKALAFQNSFKKSSQDSDN